MRPQLSIIIPFHKGLTFLERALAGVTPLAAGDELIIAADGAVDDCRPLAAKYGARVIDIAGPRGPAVARNVASAMATRDVLVFVDADVVASPAVVDRMARIFEEQPDVSAVFGAYDEHPGDKGFVSQYKNLAHAYVHRVSRPSAKTFWAGFGGVRRSAFMAVGGFDERFERPSIEDIDLGYRLSSAGYRIMLDPSLAVCHLKRWTLGGMVKSDVLDRGIPWTQLILRYQQFGSDLNVRHTDRLSVVAAYLATALAAMGVADERFLAAAAGPIGLAIFWGRDYYRFFAQKRGWGFAARVVPLHMLYHLYNGVSFATGTMLFLAARKFDVHLPGALPAHAPAGPAASAPAASVTVSPSGVVVDR